MKKILFAIAATMLLAKSAAADDVTTWCCGNHPVFTRNNIAWASGSAVGCDNYGGKDCSSDRPYKVIETKNCPLAVKDLGNKTYQIDYCSTR